MKPRGTRFCGVLRSPDVACESLAARCLASAGSPTGTARRRRGPGSTLRLQDPPDGGLDQDALATLAALIGDDDPAFLAELLDDFLAGTPGQLDALGAALDGGDLETARRVAHTLKSTAATFGATELSEACRRVEAAARDGDLETARRGYLCARRHLRDALPWP